MKKVACSVSRNVPLGEFLLAPMFPIKKVTLCIGDTNSMEVLQKTKSLLKLGIEPETPQDSCTNKFSIV